MNGTDDRVDDGDITQPLTLETYVLFGYDDGVARRALPPTPRALFGAARSDHHRSITASVVDSRQH